MRFLRITYRCFGPFREKSFDLSGGQEGVHVFYGPNEAGKSTALRGARYLLFGFPSRQCEDFRYPAQKQQLEAHVRRRSGEELRFMRVRSRNPLRSLDGENLTADQWERFLEGLTEEQFQMLFGLDHRLLVEGGRQIVEGKGALGEALFAAGAGLAGLSPLQKAIRSKAEELYAPQAKTSTKINPLLRTIQDKKKQEEEAILRLEAWRRVVDERQNAFVEKQRLEAKRQKVRQEISRLKTYQGLLPSIRQFQKRQEDLRGLPDRDPILDEDKTIQELREKLGGCRKANQDQASLVKERERLNNQALGILKSVFARESLEEVEQLCPSENLREQIRTLAGQFQACREAEEKAQGQEEALTNQIEELKRRLAELPPLTDIETLRTCYEAVLQEGPLEKNLPAVEVDLEELLAEADLLLANLRACREGSSKDREAALEELANLRPPPEERIAEYQKNFDALLQDRRQLEQKIEEWEKTLRSAERAIRQLEKEGSIPTEQALQEVRRERDALLEAVRAAWLQPDQPEKINQEQVEVLVQKYAPGGHLLDALKQSIFQSDALADRLRQEAQRVAQWEAQVQRKTEAEEELRLYQQKMAEWQIKQDQLQQAWQAEWTPWDIQPKGPAEMAAWRQSYSELLNKLPSIRKLQTQQRQLQEQIAACRSRLQTALGLQSPDPNQPLQELLALAKRRIEEVNANAQQRQTLETQLSQLDRQRQTAEKDLDKATRRLQQWTADWQEAIRSLGAAPDALPEKVQKQLDQLDEIRSLLKDAEGLEERIAGIDRDREEFLHRLTQLRGRLTPDCPKSTLQTMQADLDDLEARLHKAQEVEKNRLAFQEELDRLRKELLQHAGAKPLEDFCKEVLQQADHFQPRLDELQRQEKELDDQINELNQKLGAAAKQLEDWKKAGDQAAQYRQERVSLIAQLRDLVVEYAACCAAQQILTQAVEQFRQRHQQTMLSRAGEYFRLLTCGAFERLEIEEGETGRSVLQAVRLDPAAPDREERVGVEGLSDGARDQLFLALRLAGIEEHCQRGEPMPVIIDDALVNFDNQRAVAAFQALAELSKKTQVLLFTHHEHLIALAKDHLPTEMLFCYAFS